MVFERLTDLLAKPAMKLRPLITKPPPARQHATPLSTVFLYLDPINPIVGNSVAVQVASPPALSPGTHFPSAEVDYSAHPAASIDSDSLPTPIDPESFPYTKTLLSQVIRAILADPKQYVLNSIDSVFRRFSNDVFAETDIDGMAVSRAMNDTHAIMTQYLHQPILICITSALERPESGAVAWGLTNTNEDREDEYGFLIPALNWAHCSAFEATFSDPAMLTRRSQLGSLLAITFMHELNNVVVRKGLKDLFGVFSRDFVPSELHVGKEKDAPGWHLEFAIFRGVVQVRWKATDVFQEHRFELIEDLWLQTAREPVEFPPLRLIPVSSLTIFFSEIFYNTTLTQRTILNLSCAERLEHPYLPCATVLQRDRILARGVRPNGQMSTQPSAPKGRPVIPTCLVALEHMAERYPNVYGKYWKYYARDSCD
ncbi:hypothetical protein K438DRAFT_2013548 [Mycena galopus ATCC 62051]|nr:hypothetical protein K438DRAFT_2013548 [Mycena galopus ATCC 62051]